MYTQLAPTAAPANVRITSTTTTTLTYAWDHIPCGSRGGSISYKYTLDSIPPEAGTTTATTTTLTGLGPCTSYLFKVRATNDAGDGSEGSASGSTNNESKHRTKLDRSIYL